MAIYAYTGIPGSGKSYEVVSSVILENFRKGRKIVTNIEGITEEKLVDYCLKDEKITRESLGILLKVSDSDCQKDNFFPYKGGENTICQAGDLICIDEVWRIFPNDKIHSNHRSFISEHRHFTNERGDCCDLVVINQAISGVPRFIRDRVETTFVMKKMSMLGLNKRYRVDVFTGAKINKLSLVAQYHNKYNPEIFNLYKSFDGLNGKQNVIDDRQNLFKSAKFKFILISTLTLFILSVFSIYYLYQRAKDSNKPGENKSEIVEENKNKLEPQKVDLKRFKSKNNSENEQCLKVISIKKTESGNIYLIKKGEFYETRNIINFVDICNNPKFRG